MALKNKFDYIKPHELLFGQKVKLRLLMLEDCHQYYVDWLNNPIVNAYLETRWYEQSRESIRDFVVSMQDNESNYLFAIIDQKGDQHVGNIKLGPINWFHRYADISYFIGEPSHWGKGLASDAIATVSEFGLKKLKLHRLQAGLYAGNVGSRKALEKAGYEFEACFKQQLLGLKGWEDHLWFRKLNEDISC